MSQKNIYYYILYSQNPTCFLAITFSFQFNLGIKQSSDKLLRRTNLLCRWALKFQSHNAIRKLLLLFWLLLYMQRNKEAYGEWGGGLKVTQMVSVAIYKWLTWLLITQSLKWENIPRVSWHHDNVYDIWNYYHPWYTNTICVMRSSVLSIWLFNVKSSKWVPAKWLTDDHYNIMHDWLPLKKKFSCHLL